MLAVADKLETPEICKYFETLQMFSGIDNVLRN